MPCRILAFAVFMLPALIRRVGADPALRLVIQGAENRSSDALSLIGSERQFSNAVGHRFSLNNCVN